MPETVKVRIAVMLDDAGHYVAYGDSQYTSARQKEHLLERIIEEFENVSSSRHTHIKFLEIDLPIPNTEAVNIEAQEDNSVPPGIRLQEPE